MLRCEGVIRRTFAVGAAFALGFGAPALWPTEARADSRVIAARVLDQWKKSGAKAVLLPSRFVFDDETVLVPIPPVEGPGSCVHVAVIAARGLSFHAKLEGASNDPLLPDTGARANSLAGVLEMRRCEARGVRHIQVTSDAGRGAVEVIVARSPGNLPNLPAVIPERTGGVLPPVPEAGVLPALIAPDKRARAAEQRAQREGGTVHTRQAGRAGDDGSGEVEVTLAPGCHRIEIFAKDPRVDRPGRRVRLDVDAELRDTGDDKLLARDRTEAPDARLETCVGRATNTSVVFAGAPPASDVIVTRAGWPLPAHLPEVWGPPTKGRMARVLYTRHVAAPTDPPIFLAQGASGGTPLPLPVEVGGCYVAIVGVVKGTPRALQLRAFVGARESSDERGAADQAALAAFCVRAHESARLEVQARGTGVQWGVAVYRVRSGVWETGR